MLELIMNPFGFLLLWIDIGILLMAFGEYWFTVRRGYKIDVTGEYVLKFFLLSLLGILIINRIVEELFRDNPEFLTNINYKDNTETIEI